MEKEDKEALRNNLDVRLIEASYPSIVLVIISNIEIGYLKDLINKDLNDNH